MELTVGGMVRSWTPTSGKPTNQRTSTLSCASLERLLVLASAGCRGRAVPAGRVQSLLDPDNPCAAEIALRLSEQVRQELGENCGNMAYEWARDGQLDAILKDTHLTVVHRNLCPPTVGRMLCPGVHLTNERL